MPDSEEGPPNETTARTPSHQLTITKGISWIDVTESQWRTLVPTAAATNETNGKTSRAKFMTCVFLAGVGTEKYGRLKTELNNAFVAGQNNYPNEQQ
jgi:hypothetical protein